MRPKSFFYLLPLTAVVAMWNNTHIIAYVIGVPIVFVVIAYVKFRRQVAKYKAMLNTPIQPTFLIGNAMILAR